MRDLTRHSMLTLEKVIASKRFPDHIIVLIEKSEDGTNAIGRVSAILKIYNNNNKNIFGDKCVSTMKGFLLS